MREKVYYSKEVKHYEGLNLRNGANIRLKLTNYYLKICDINNRDILNISLKDTDYTILEKIKCCMKSEHPIVRHIKKRNPYTKSNHLVLEQCSLTINGKTLVKPLIEMKLGGNKTYTLDSNIMRYVPSDLVRHFLRGYFDGDGCVTWGKHYSSGYKYIVQIAGNKDFLLNSS